MNATDHINVVLWSVAYMVSCLISRATASPPPNSIVTAIVNSDAYSPVGCFSALLKVVDN